MILIKGVHVFAPQDMGIKDVLVGGTKILKIGDNLPAEEAYGVEVIDGTGNRGTSCTRSEPVRRWCQ